MKKLKKQINNKSLFTSFLFVDETIFPHVEQYVEKKVSVRRDPEWWFKFGDNRVLLIAPKGIPFKELIHPLAVLYPRHVYTYDRELRAFLGSFGGTSWMYVGDKTIIEGIPGETSEKFIGNLTF